MRAYKESPRVGSIPMFCIDLHSCRCLSVFICPNHVHVGPKPSSGPSLVGLSRPPLLQKEACKNLREDINQLVCDVHLKDENSTEGNNTTGCIDTVTNAQAREECTGVSWKEHGAFSQPNPKYYSSPSAHHPSTSLLNHSYCADDDREVHQSQNNSSLGDCNQTVENQCPERYDQTTGDLSSLCGRTDALIPAHLCGCEDDDGLDGLQKNGRRLDSEDDVNGSPSSSLKVEIGMASLAGDHCLIIADDVNGGATERLKDSSSNSEQPFNMNSSSDDLLKGSTGHEIPSEPAPASLVGDVSGGPNSFSVPSYMTSDKHGSFDSPQLEEDERASSHSMAPGDGAVNGKGKDEINLLKAGDIFDSITTTIHEEPIDIRAYHIGTPQSISEPALSKEGAKDHQLTLTECCFVASLLQSIYGRINSDQIALPIQVDSSHLVGVHLDSSDMINAGLYVESQWEVAFDELDVSAPANVNVIFATNCVETECSRLVQFVVSPHDEVE